MKKFLTVILTIILTTACVFAGCFNKDVFEGNYIEVSEEKFKEYAEKIQESERSVDYEKGYRLAMNGNSEKETNETETSDAYVYNAEYFIKRVDGELLMQGKEFRQYTRDGYSGIKRQKLFYKDKTLFSNWYGRDYDDHGYGKKEMEEDELVQEFRAFLSTDVKDVYLNTQGEDVKYYVCETKNNVKLKLERTMKDSDVGDNEEILNCVFDNNGRIMAVVYSASSLSKNENFSLDITIVPWSGKFDFPSALENAVYSKFVKFFSRGPFF